jgi:hypothetical protein
MVGINAGLLAVARQLRIQYQGAIYHLAARRKSDPQKVALARVLRSQTPMSLKWIARRLEMGSWTYVSNLLRQ